MYVLLLFRLAVEVGRGRDWTTAVVVIVIGAGCAGAAFDFREADGPAFPC